MSVNNCIRDWMAGECELLEDFRELFVDYLDDSESYMLEFTPADPIVRRFINGASIRRKQFSFCSRVIYDALENIDTSDFFERFSEWMEACNKAGNLPQLPAGREAQTIRALTDGYLYDETGKMGQYRIQCELIYFQEE